MELFVIVVFLTVTGAQQNQLEGPQNTLSIVAASATLKCLSPSRNCNGIDWQKYVIGASPMTIFKNSRILAVVDRDRYSVDNSSGCDLIIRNVQLTDAGRFICSTIFSTSQETKTAHLIILETQPKCKLNASLDSTVEGDGVQLNCAVSYNGTNEASMVWKGVTDAPAARKNGTAMSRSHIVVASASGVPSFTCETSFTIETVDNGKPIVGLATNSVPKSICSTSPIELLCLLCSTTDTTTTVTVTDNPLRYILMAVAVGILLLIILLIVCFCTEACPGYKFYNSRRKSKVNSRAEQPLTENPDVIYSVVNKRQDNHHKAISPKRPKDPPPQTNASNADAYQHEEVTYADLAMEYGPRKVVPQNRQAAQEESLYAAVIIA